MTTETTTPPDGIDTAMIAIMRDVDHLAKREKNNHYGFMFRGIDAVLNALGPVMRRHGVYLLPRVESRTYDQVQTAKNKPSTACRVTVTYQFVAADGSSVETTVIGEAWDEGDKGTSKAMSVALRTAMLQVFALPTDEPDPDEFTYEQAAPEPLISQVTGEALVGRMAAYGVQDEADQIGGVSALLGRDLNDLTEVTETEGRNLIEYLDGLIARKQAEAAPATQTEEQEQ